MNALVGEDGQAAGKGGRVDLRSSSVGQAQERSANQSCAGQPGGKSNCNCEWWCLGAVDRVVVALEKEFSLTQVVVVSDTPLDTYFCEMAL